jgi:hypothetical protein
MRQDSGLLRSNLLLNNSTKEIAVRSLAAIDFLTNVCIIIGNEMGSFADSIKLI